MKELNELVELAKKADYKPCRIHDHALMQACRPETILAIAEAFRALEQRAEAAEAKLAELEKQASEQKPFMYGIMTANGDAHFEDFCVSSDPGLLEDVIWEWNNTLADNEPKNRVVGLFTRTAPAINLAELVNDDEFRVSFERWMTDDIKCVIGSSDPYPAGIEARNWNAWKACRSAIMRNIEEAK